jgi:predicted transcriptional regulator
MHRGYTCLWRKIWFNPVLVEPGKRFWRLEAWLYITNVLAAGKDDAAAGLKRGEFVASIRQLAEGFNWSRSAVHRFLEVLLENSMIMRVVRETGHSAGQEAGHFIVCNYETYNSPRNAKRNAERNTYKEVFKESKNKIKDTRGPAPRDACVSPQTLLEIYQQHNQALPGVKALTAERLRRCRSRINQAVRDGCLEQYLADFVAAVKKAQSTPFLRGEGLHGWRASFDWFVANQVNVYAVLEGKYDGPAAGPNHGGGNDNASFAGGRFRPPGLAGRTSRGDPIYIPRQ